MNKQQPESEMLKHALWLASSFTVHRYLMSNAEGRWSGAEKAACHDELCCLYVAVFRGVEVDQVRVGLEADWMAVHDATQELTDHMDAVIGFPLKGVPDYDALAPKFFDHFHRLAAHTLRASHGQAPAGAGMGHTDGGRNMFYEGRFDGESQREQQARLRWANDMRAAFERHTGNGWFDKDWRTETGLWSSAWHACLAAQPSPTAQAEEAVALDHIAVIEDGELRYMTGRKAPAYDCELYAMPDGKRAPVLFTAPQTVAREPLDEARRLFDAGWKAAALFCDREDVVADGITGFGACQQFEAAFSAANGIKGDQHGTK